jgi:ubiquinone/menaquinone biosynthesis C-methylase UbiE
MQRIPEPELMLDPEQAAAYAVADFEEPHARCIELLRERLCLGPTGRALDLGAGNGDISLRFARAFPGWSIDAIDGSPAMLELGRRALARSGLGHRLRFHHLVLPCARPLQARYDAIFSNSLLHHLADPATLWTTITRWSQPATRIFVMDLLRPDSPEAARQIVEANSAAEPEVLRRDFYNSLLAAYRPAEIQQQLAAAGLQQLRLEVVSDRHFIVHGSP